MVTPPPTTRRGDDCDVLHGVEVPDPYRWLEDGEAVEVGQWVAEHNRRTLEALTRPARGRWHERLSALSALPTIMSLAVAGELGGLSRGNQGGDRDEAAVPGRQLSPPPDVAVEHLVGELCQAR